jgi:hypothetical protein
VLFFTDCVRTERGPVLNSSSSRFASSSGVISDFGLVKRVDLKKTKFKHVTYHHKYKLDWKLFSLRYTYVIF